MKVHRWLVYSGERESDFYPREILPIAQEKKKINIYEYVRDFLLI